MASRFTPERARATLRAVRVIETEGPRKGIVTMEIAMLATIALMVLIHVLVSAG